MPVGVGLRRVTQPLPRPRSRTRPAPRPSGPRRTQAVLAGFATFSLSAVAVTAGATAAHAAQPPHNEQVALVDGTDAQLEFNGAASSTGQTASHDGRYVVFSTDAPQVAEDTNEVDDVYLRHLAAGTTVLVSEVDGTPGNDYSYEPTISADGRAVSFQTFGAFGRRDDDRREDVYVRNLDKGWTRQGSLLAGRGGDVRFSVLNGDLSGDGSVVTFGDNNNLWARNVRTGKTIRFWHEPDSPPCQPFPGGSAGRPAISADGRFAAFASCATDLPGEDGEATDVYRINLRTGNIVRVHPEGDGNSFLPSLSSNGRYIGFGSEAANLVPGDTHSPDAFVADLRSGTVTRASQAPDGTGGDKQSASNDVAISGDGHTLVYQSYASNLVPGDAFDLREVFVWRAQAPDPIG